MGCQISREDDGLLCHPTQFQSRGRPPTPDSGVETKCKSQAHLVQQLTPSSGISDQRKSDRSQHPICEMIILMLI